MGNAIKHIIKNIYIIIDVHSFTQRSHPIGYSDQPMTNRDFPVSHSAVSVTYREMVTIVLNSTVANKRHTP